MWSESSSVSTVNLEKKFATVPEISINFFPRGYFFMARPVDIKHKIIPKIQPGQYC